MLTRLSKKILPVILAFTLVAPSVFGQSIPALAATGNDGVAVVQAEDSLVQEEGTENTEAIEVSQAEGTLEEGIYTMPLTAYGIGKPQDMSAYGYGWIAQTSTAVGGNGLPGFNERAKIEVVSGGAITLTVRVDSILEYDAFQIMRLEKSSEYGFGEKTDTANWQGNAAIAKLPMGTFNLPQGYLLAGTTNASLFEDNSNSYYYQTEDGFLVRKNAENGYTELSLQINSLDQLDKLVIKNALSIDKSFPVGTSFLVFQKDNIVKVPSLEEFAQLTGTSVQVTDLLSTDSTKSTASKVPEVRKTYIDNLFTEAFITVENEQITVSGSMNPESFKGNYGLRHIRQYTGTEYLKDGATDTERLNYRNPYYKTQFATFYNKYTAGEEEYEYSFTFDYTLDNLIYGVPISMTGLRSTGTNAGTNYEFPDYTEAELNQKTASFGRFHLLPKAIEQIVRYSGDGDIRLVTDTATLPDSVNFEAYNSTNISQYNTLYSLSKQKEDGSKYLKAYTYSITVSGSAITTSKDMELGIKVPEDWERNNNLYAMWFLENNGAVFYQYKDGSLKIDEEGYVTVKTNQPMGELYLYVQETPEDLEKLEPGIYSADITAMHNSQQGRPSMANNALEKEAVLVVSRDSSGKLVKELYLNFKVMYIGSIEGHLSNVAAANNYKGEQVTYGEILDYFTVGDSGELLTEPSYKEPYGINVYLAKSAKVSLEKYTGSEELYQNYYPVYFEVPPMDSDPTDGINLQAVRLMVSNVQKAEGSLSIPAYKKTVLKKALNDGGEYEGDMYTAKSFETLTAALETARKVYDKEPSEAEILQQVSAIEEAILGLEVDETKKADKTVLEELLKKAESYRAGDYTATSFENLKEVMVTAKGVYEKEAARQSEVDEQVKVLRAAIDALVPVDLGAISPDKLPDGVYTIPIRLWHAIKDNPSMGDAAVVRNGILEIKDKKATLRLEMKPLIFAGLTGYLMQFNILSEYTMSPVSGYPENYIKNPAEILETYDHIDRYNGEDSEDELCRGKKYPKMLQFGVTLPEAAGVDYTWVHVYVPVMGELDNGDQEARLRLDYTAITRVGEPSISLNYNSLKLTVGETKILTADLTNTENAVTFSSSDPAIVSVDNNGKLEALAVGTATITAVAGSVSAQCIVTVALAGTGTNPGGGQGADTDLKDGTYSIPIKLWHANKDQVSMGNAALVQTAKLVIDKGSGTLYLTFQSMNYLGQTGYLSELSPSTVISTYRVVDQFNSETSTDDRVRGRKYPKMLAVSVVPGEEYTGVGVYVPVMGSLGVGEQEARLKLYYSSAIYISDSTDQESAASDADLYFKEGEAVEGAEENKAETKVMMTEKGKKYFYEFDVKLTSQFIAYYGKYYYVGEDGAALTSQFITHDGNLYYAGESGAMLTYELLTVGKKKYYAGKGGIIATSTMVTYKGKEYYAYKTGRLANSAMVTYEGKKYYAGKDGAIVKGAMITHKGKKYYVYQTGRLAVSAMITHNDKQYYTYKTGRIAASTMVTYKGRQYYAYKTGRIATSAIITYKNQKYYVGKDGAVVISKWVTIKGIRYYFDKNGKLKTTKNPV
jgi:glucan-binding YG repeat protein